MGIARGITSITSGIILIEPALGFVTTNTFFLFDDVYFHLVSGSQSRFAMIILLVQKYLFLYHRFCPLGRSISC